MRHINLSNGESERLFRIDRSCYSLFFLIAGTPCLPGYNGQIDEYSPRANLGVDSFTRLECIVKNSKRAKVLIISRLAKYMKEEYEKCLKDYPIEIMNEKDANEKSGEWEFLTGQSKTEDTHPLKEFFVFYKPENLVYMRNIINGLLGVISKQAVRIVVPPINSGGLACAETFTRMMYDAAQTCLQNFYHYPPKESNSGPKGFFIG